MSDYLIIQDTTLTAIGDAIRERGETSEELTPAEMVEAIYEIPGGEPVIEPLTITANGTYTAQSPVDGYNTLTVNVPTGPDPQDLVFTGDCSQLAMNGHWDFIVEKYGNSLEFNDITSISQMFDFSQLTSLPFTINLVPETGSTMINANYGFIHMWNLTNPPVLSTDTAIVSKFTQIDSLFEGCNRLRNLPSTYFDNLQDADIAVSRKIYSMEKAFKDCYSLRNIPTFAYRDTLYGYFFANHAFENCYVLDSVEGLPLTNAVQNHNLEIYYGDVVKNCYRLKKFTFIGGNREQGYSYEYNITLDMRGVGFRDAPYDDTLLTSDYNSGITDNKNIFANGESTVAEAKANYDLLKNDPDWFAQTDAIVDAYNLAMYFSRYNHDSAVETIRSLPYLESTGVGTIRFTALSGLETDGGAINTMTAQEIASATTRNWTVAY